MAHEILPLFFNKNTRNPEIQRRIILSHQRMHAASWRKNALVRAQFMALWLYGIENRCLYHILHMMHKTSVLGHYLPEFRRIMGRMQYDLFHVYTVDQHILQVVHYLEQLHQLAFSTRIHDYIFHKDLVDIMRDSSMHICIYFAVFFHDIGKGSGFDHALVGAQLALDFCHVHHMHIYDAQFICWLVEYHLALSHLAQKQNMDDPEVVQNFCDHILFENKMHDKKTSLNALYVLAVVDIYGSNPNAWNHWKSDMLNQAYHKCLEGLNKKHIQEKDSCFNVHINMDSRIEPCIESYMESQKEFLHKTDAHIWQKNKNGYCDLYISAPNRSYLFSDLCGFLTQNHIGIHDAKLQTYDDRASDILIIEKPLNDHLLIELKKILMQKHASFYHFQYWQNSMKRHFPTPLSIDIKARDVQARLYIKTTDHPGLLYNIAYFLSSEKISIQRAQINTFGDRAEDVFTLYSKKFRHDVYIKELIAQLRHLLSP